MPKLDQYTSPEDLAAALTGKHPDKRRFLGVDLGTNCGVAWADISKDQTLKTSVLFGGQLDLGVLPYETGPLRFIRLKQFLSVLQPDVIGYEDVKYTPGGEFGRAPVGVIMSRVSKSAELLGGLKVIMSTWAEEHGIPVQALGIGQIKKFATGKGNAGKEKMIEAANKAYGLKLETEDYKSTGADNIADAMHIVAMLIEGYKDAFK